MGKKWRVFLAAFLILAGCGAYGVYHYFFNRDITPEDVHVDEDFFDFSSVLETTVQPVATRDQQSDDNGQQGEKNGSQQDNEGAMHADESSSGKTYTGASGSGSKSSPVSEKTIRAKYYPTFQRLQREAVARLNQLAKNALADYQKSKKTGEPSLSEIAAKYTSAAKKLEGGVDAAFYRLLDQMKSDLQAAGLPLDLAEEAERIYKAQIEQKKAELLSKALGK